MSIFECIFLNIMALGKSARYYHSNPEAREKKKKYDTAYHKTPARRRYRSKLWMERRRRGIAGSYNGKDLSHKKDGSLVLENSSKNRARQGSGGKSSKK
jgi:hypothetical protein